MPKSAKEKAIMAFEDIIKICEQLPEKKAKNIIGISKAQLYSLRSEDDEKDSV